MSVRVLCAGDVRVTHRPSDAAGAQGLGCPPQERGHWRLEDLLEPPQRMRGFPLTPFTY